MLQMEQHKDTRFKALLYPVANYLCLAFLAGVIFFMAQIPDMQLAVISLPIWLIVLAIGYQLYKKNQPQA